MIESRTPNLTPTTPNGTGVVSVTNGAFDAPSSLNTRLAVDPAASRTALGVDASGTPRPPQAHGAWHVSSGSDPIPDALPSGASGLLSGADKEKLDALPSSAYVDAGDAETLAAAQDYTDASVQAFVPKGSCRAVITATSLSTLLGGATFNAGLNSIVVTANGELGTVDGVNGIDLDDIIMVPFLTSSDAKYTGPYKVTSLGSSTSQVVLTRTNNFSTTASIRDGAYVLVSDGLSAHDGYLYHLTSEVDLSFVLNTTAMTWTERRLNILLSNSTPAALSSANAGTSPAASRADHVHEMPSASDVGADAAGTAVTTVSQRTQYIPIGGTVVCRGTQTVAGAIYIDPVALAIPGKTTVLTLIFFGDVNASITGTVTLYDLTASAAAATLTVTSTTEGNVQTAPVTVPGAAHAYSLRLAHNSVSDNYLLQRVALLRVSWT